MNWRGAEANQWITDPTVRMLDNVIILSWQWPKDIEYVYIVKGMEGQELSFGEGSSLPMKLYTKEEYKANAGYKDYLHSLGRVTYKIYPAIRENGSMVILEQENDNNEIIIKGHKAKIIYSIQYKNNLFSKQKTVKIIINSEVSLPKEILCYVKKKGSNPSGTEDGSIYPFANDFNPGRNTLPEIQVHKDDYIRLFFTNGKEYGELYELIPE